MGTYTNFVNLTLTWCNLSTDTGGMEGMEALAVTGVTEDQDRMDLESPILTAATVVSGEFFLLFLSLFLVEEGLTPHHIIILLVGMVEMVAKEELRGQVERGRKGQL